MLRSEKTRLELRHSADQSRDAMDRKLESLINLLMVIEGNAEMAERHGPDGRLQVALSRVVSATDKAAVLAHELLATVVQMNDNRGTVPRASNGAQRATGRMAGWAGRRAGAGRP